MNRSRAVPVVCVLLAVCQSLAWADSGPVETVKKLNAGLEGVLRDSAQLDYKARYDRIAPVIREAYDLDFMARQALGKESEALAPADQARWVAAFTDLTNATYAGRLDHWSGQTFETLGEEAAAHDTMVVRTRVVDPGAENVDLNYRLRETDGRWRVIDVYLKGSVSEVALRRSEYSSVLKHEGFEALLAAVNKKIADLAAGTAK
jgi:phospholipid transport system substrate-binding protein